MRATDLHSVDDADTAVVVDVADVARVLPALLVNGGFGALLVYCVARTVRLSSAIR